MSTPNKSETALRNGQIYHINKMMQASSNPVPVDEPTITNTFIPARITPAHGN